MPVRAFTDDSGSGGDSRYYVLCGYMADLPTWEKFSDAWHAFLNTPPTLTYFKMSEAESLKGEFENWEPRDRDRKIDGFIDIILSCDPFQGSSAIAEEDYQAIVKPALGGRWGGQYDDPYLFLFMNIVGLFSSMEFRWEHAMRGLAPGELVLFDKEEYSGQPPERVDFVFDEDTKRHEKYARIAYDQSLKGLDVFRDRLGSVDFRDDKVFMPLQAADLAAWQRRRRICVNEPERSHYQRLNSMPKRFKHDVMTGSELLGVLHKITDALKSAQP